VVDLVGDEPDAAVAAPGGKPREVGSADHRSRRIGRACDDQSVEPARLGEQFQRWLVMGILADRDQHRLDVECGQDVAVGRIARNGETHPVARFEGGEKGELKGGRRAGRDNDLGRVDQDAVLRPVVRGNRLP
jgi:hypothetical protein